MKRCVQILLITLFLFPLISFAREETMEERKQRITRKYLRERTNLALSESMVPVDESEDENIVDSERFREPQVEFKKQEPGGAMPLPPRRPVPQVENRNWLMAEEPSIEDPYADPFAPKEAEEKSKGQDAWARREQEQESSPYDRTPRESWYQRRNPDSSTQQNPSRYDPNNQGAFFSRNPQIFSPGSMQPGSPQQSGLKPFSSGKLDLSRDHIFNPGMDQGRLKNPALRGGAPSEDRTFGSDSMLKKQGGYTPYKSPYETRREQQQGGGGIRQPRQDYQKPNAFQQWKDQNPTRFDPTRDDAFIDEVMPDRRR
jgi:hypothetical protein